MVSARTTVACGLLVPLALLACKSSDDAPAPSAMVAPTGETAEPAASASAAPSSSADETADTSDAGDAEDAGEPEKKKVAVNPAASVQACCNALNAAAKKPGMTQNKYKAAAAVCSGIAARVKKGAANAASARTTIRAQLQGVPIPSGC